MTLSPCRECGEQVSTQAKSCPKCGVPDPSGASSRTGRCLGCGKDISVAMGESCPHCHVTDPLTPFKRTVRGRPTTSSDPRWEATKTIGLVGCALLFVGVFTPVVRAPFVGSVNYFQNGQGDGVVIIALSLVGAGLCAAGRVRWLWGTSLGSLAIMGFTFISVWRIIEVARQEMSVLDGTIFESVGQIALQSVQIQWGWGILLLGVILTAVAAFRSTVEA